MSAVETRLPVTVLSGFLGAAKTTLLHHLVQLPQMSRAMMIINEFGAVGLDHDLNARSREDPVVEILRGCLLIETSMDL